ncbi:hypothetical protein CLM76_09540 [Vreelandella venusta]|nr:hypothetical protein CLM76_09540 [Halomonas hydrothermalis]
MREVIDFISAISVLVASLAGLSAINKWKSERFDKRKIEAIEGYEAKIKDVASRIKEAVNSDIVYSDYSWDSTVDLTDILKYEKEGRVDGLRSTIDEARLFLDQYRSFSGNRLSFNFNYYSSTFFLMESCLSFVCYENIFDEREDFDFNIAALRFFDKEEDKIADVVDLLMVHSPIHLYFVAGLNNIYFNDFRRKYSDVLMSLARLEKIYIYSNILSKMLIKTKIFILEYRVSGRVLCHSHRNAIILGDEGNVFRVPTQGKSYEALEKDYRKKVLRKMIAKRISDFVMY